MKYLTDALLLTGAVAAWLGAGMSLVIALTTATELWTLTLGCFVTVVCLTTSSKLIHLTEATT